MKKIIIFVILSLVFSGCAGYHIGVDGKLTRNEIDYQQSEQVEQVEQVKKVKKIKKELVSYDEAIYRLSVIVEKYKTIKDGYTVFTTYCVLSSTDIDYENKKIKVNFECEDSKKLAYSLPQKIGPFVKDQNTKIYGTDSYAAYITSFSKIDINTIPIPITQKPENENNYTTSYSNYDYTSSGTGYSSPGTGYTYVQGHFRHYKSGKVSYVRGHYRRK